MSSRDPGGSSHPPTAPSCAPEETPHTVSVTVAALITKIPTGFAGLGDELMQCSSKIKCLLEILSH